MTKRYRKENYTPQNPEKYDGEYPIVSRSSWETEFMKYCDMHPDVAKWSSEPVQIPYRDPLTGNQKVYVPDFLVTFITKSRETTTKLIEIKPMHEQLSEHARNSSDAAVQARNRAKWGAAIAWAGRRGIEFVVMNESNMFAGHENRRARANPVREYAPATTKDMTPKPKLNKKKQRAQQAVKKFRAIKSRVNKGGSASKAPRVAKARKA